MFWKFEYEFVAGEERYQTQPVTIRAENAPAIADAPVFRPRQYPSIQCGETLAQFSLNTRRKQAINGERSLLRRVAPEGHGSSGRMQ